MTAAAGGGGGKPPPRGGSGGGAAGRGRSGSASSSDGAEPSAKRPRIAGRELEARQLGNRRATRAQAAGEARPEVRSASGRRATASSRAAAAAGRAQRVGDAVAAMATAAAEVPGSYASAAIANQGFNRRAGSAASGRARRADHAPTDWSQRGPAVARESASNSADTIRRPAFSVPATRHDAHPTTVHGHEEGGVAARERHLQVTGGSGSVASGARAAAPADFEEGRVLATQLHLRHYGRDPAWPRMGARDRGETRASLERSLAAPTRVNTDRGGALASVALSEASRRRVLHTFDRSVAGDFGGGYTSDTEADTRSDAERRRQRQRDLTASRATAFGAAAAAAPVPGRGAARVATAAAAAAAPARAPRAATIATAAAPATAPAPRRGAVRVAVAAATAAPEPGLAGTKRKRGDR